MPVLDPNARMNFAEVELGYNDENIVKQEANRCLECGCTAFFDCDLQKHATEYRADQTRFAGEFNAFDVDFSHPFIEFDRNKCILCGKCVRICHEYVGANALGLVNRGFVTYVSPDLDGSLLDTKCETCGMCISVCPTGALMENYKFKPGPIEATPLRVVDFFGSEGVSYDLYDRSGFFMGADGAPGVVNPDGSIGRQQRFGYNVLNRLDRVKVPLMKKEGGLSPVTFEEAFRVISEKISASEPDRNIFFAGARLSNEEMYMVQKMARAGVKTNNIASFHYMGRCHGYLNSSDDNVPFNELEDATAFFVVGAELTEDNQYTGFLVNNIRYRKGTPVKLFTMKEESSMVHKSDEVTQLKSYYSFIQAVNHYIVKNTLYNKMYIDDHCEGFDEYAAEAGNKNLDDLVKAAGVSVDIVVNFATEFTSSHNPVLIFSEKDICSDTAQEISNLAMLSGTLGKRSAGILCLKEKNNSQGLIDAGISSGYLPGNREISGKDSLAVAEQKWGVEGLSERTGSVKTRLMEGDFDNLFIFGEDPAGCAVDRDLIAGVLSGAGFMVVQDYTLTDTALLADIVLPATYPFETGGSFTNTQRFLQTFGKESESPVEMNNLEQLAGIASGIGMEVSSDHAVILDEMFAFLSEERKERKFVVTGGKGKPAMFLHGADALVRLFDDYFREEIDK
ncbi:MAG: molybdopterin-dependent oxidoreductase [Bacteroidales bacterium]